jgi:hypothetical protein
MEVKVKNAKSEALVVHLQLISGSSRRKLPPHVAASYLTRKTMVTKVLQRLAIACGTYGDIE